MTRSDILFAKAQLSNIHDRDVLIEILHNKIENVYDILFGIESYGQVKKDDTFDELAKYIRKGLES